jgi:hypothetical protein
VDAVATKIDLELTQRRYTATVSGVIKYKIEISVQRGADPAKWTHDPQVTPQVMVMTIAAATADDAFARVANIADLDLVEGQRSVAVTNSKTEYRSSAVTLSFDDLDTAVAAVPVIKDRVNSLLTVWNKAQTDFLNSGAKTNLPTASTVQTVEAAAISDYTTDRDARRTAQTDQDTAQTAFADAQKDTADKLVIRDIHCDYKARLNEIDGLTNAATGAILAAAVALEAAADNLARTTRAKEAGTVTAAGTNVQVTDTGKFAGDTYAGDLVAVTFSNPPASGKTEVRTILSHTNDTLTVHTAFSQIPTDVGTPDKWEVRLLNEFLPSADFGATSSAADSARAAHDEVTKAAGLDSVVDTHVTFATGECTTTTATHVTAVATETTKLSELNDRKALKDVAQTKENVALAALLEVCPDKDVSTL